MDLRSMYEGHPTLILTLKSRPIFVKQVSQATSNILFNYKQEVISCLVNKTM